MAASKSATKRRLKRPREGPTVAATPVPGERALLLAPRGGPRTLVVGDLHIGIETEYAFGGVKIPSGTPSMVARLVSLQQLTQAANLVIAGDLKHSVLAITEQEGLEVPRALREMAQAFKEVVVVPGNHDGRAEELIPSGAPNVRLAPVGGHLCRGGLLVIHGHAWPDPKLARRARGLALAHNHTAIALEDALGRVHKEPCWARGEVNPQMWADKTGAASYPEVILLPPFNPLCTGVPINVQGVAPIGPLLREGCVDVPRARLYLLDGLLLGRVRNLEVRVSDGALRRLSRGISEDL